jgi:chloramphenicol O-acetyltransferase type A
MKHVLDLDTWARKEHFLFFNQFEEPLFGVNVTVDCTKAYTEAKRKGVSFFLYSLYRSLEAANSLEPFRYRIENGQVMVYDIIDGGSTVARPNGTFGYGSFPYDPVFENFIATATKEAEDVQQRTDLVRSTAENIIRFSSLPWIDFTALSHARLFSVPDSCPRISFGKITVHPDGKRTMPMSIHVHHALVDGIHVGQYIERFQEMMDRAIE